MEKNYIKTGKELEKPVENFVAFSQRLEIKTDEDVASASQTIKKISETGKSIEEQRLKFTKPLNESLKNINAFFKQFSEPLDKADKLIRSKVLWYRQEQEKLRIEAQSKLDENARKEQERLAELAKKKGVEAPKVYAPQVVEQETKIGATTFRKVWTFKVTDLTKVPVEFLEVNSVLAREAIAKGVREIPGLEIFQEERVSL